MTFDPGTSVLVSEVYSCPARNNIPSGNIGLDSGAFLLTTKLFDHVQSNCSMSNYWGSLLPP